MRDLAQLVMRHIQPAKAQAVTLVANVTERGEIMAALLSAEALAAEVIRITANTTPPPSPIEELEC